MAEHLHAGLRCSDVLELSGSFVLGALEPAEADAVRAHLAACPEAHAEMAELGGVVPALFETVETVEPPAGLRERILAAAAAEQAAGAVGRAPATQESRTALPAAGFPTAVDPAGDSQLGGAQRGARREVARDERQRGDQYPALQPARGGGRLGSIFRRPIWAPLALAAALAVVALGAWNIQLRGEVDSLAAYRNGVVAVLDQAARPGAALAVLTPPEGAAGPSGLAAVAADGSVALVMRDLAPTSGTQVYETWLIAADGAPVPIGGFTVGSGGAATFATAHTSLGQGVTVALTLEDGPGATAPKLPIVVLGTAAQSS